jgi:hypothetical protein
MYPFAKTGPGQNREDSKRDALSCSDMAALKRVTGPLGMEWILTKWSAPGPWQNEARQLMPQGVDGFASYWVETVANMSAVGLCPEHLDLMNEPDSNGQWSLVRKHTVPSLFPSAILTVVPSLSWQFIDRLSRDDCTK